MGRHTPPHTPSTGPSAEPWALKMVCCTAGFGMCTSWKSLWSGSNLGDYRSSAAALEPGARLQSVPSLEPPEHCAHTHTHDYIQFKTVLPSVPWLGVIYTLSNNSNDNWTWFVTHREKWCCSWYWPGLRQDVLVHALLSGRETALQDVLVLLRQLLLHVSLGATKDERLNHLRHSRRNRDDERDLIMVTSTSTTIFPVPARLPH